MNNGSARMDEYKGIMDQSGWGVWRDNISAKM